MKRIMLLAALGLAVPAFASDQPVVLDDVALDQVSGGGDSVPVATVTTNTNVSPIIVIQNAYAINTQLANTGNSAWGHQQGKNHCKNKCKKKGFGSTTGSITQRASATAFNIATINYTVTQGN